MDSPWANSARSLASSLACLLSAACCLLTAGCNNSGRQMQTDLYQRELRLQEDEIYRLEDYIEEYQGIVRGYRCKVEDLERDLTERRDALDAPAANSSRRPEALPPPAATRPDPPEALDLDQMPAIETPAADMPAIEMPETLSPPAQAPPSLDAPAAGGEPSLFDGANASPMRPSHTEPASAESIETVALVEAEPTPPNPYPLAKPVRYTPPVASTDPSVRLDIEAGAESGAFVATVGTGVGTGTPRFDGEASVMLTDPTLGGRQRRIARWDFTTREVAEAAEAGGSLLRLQAALPSGVPEDRPLRVWVRLVDANGQKRLQATEVQFADGELRASETLPKTTADTSPARLPPIGAPRAIAEPSRESFAEASTAEGWRAASGRVPTRRLDTAVAPASFESDW